MSGIGNFVCVDDSTNRKESMDVARILYKTKVHDLVSRIVKVKINDDIFSIKMVEEWYGPLQWCSSNRNNGSSSSNFEDNSKGEESNFPIIKEAGVLLDEEEIANYLNHGNLIAPYSLEAVSAVGGTFNEENGQIHGIYVVNGGSDNTVIVEPVNSVPTKQQCNFSNQAGRSATFLGPVLEPILEDMGPVIDGPVIDAEEVANEERIDPCSLGSINSAVGENNGPAVDRPENTSQTAPIEGPACGVLKDHTSKIRPLCCPSEPQHIMSPILQSSNPIHGYKAPIASCPEILVNGKPSLNSSKSRIPTRIVASSSSGAPHGNSCFETDSDILRCNKIFWKRREQEVTSKGPVGSNVPHMNNGFAAAKGVAALKVWNMARELGVNGKEGDSFYVTQLQNMEDR